MGQRACGAFRNGEAIAVSTAGHVCDAVIDDDWRQTLANHTPDHPLTTVAARCARIRPHQGHRFLAVAAGDADVAIGTGGHCWNYAAAKIIVEEAGGRFTDVHGIVRIGAKQAVVANGLVHQEVLTALREDAAGSQGVEGQGGLRLTSRQRSCRFST